MRYKYKVLAKFKEWKAKVDTRTGRKVRYLQSNNGGEYKYEFEDFYKAEGVTRHFTIPYSSTKWCCRNDEQNLVGTS